MPTFKIVNPKIIGGFDEEITAVDKNEAAKQAWARLSEHITGNVPTFVFTIENGDTQELVSFEVNETPTGKYADYTIEELKVEMTPKQEKEFRAEVARLDRTGKELQKGGRKHRYDRDDSSSSSSSDDSVYDKLKLFKAINNPKPIVYWWYTPVIYKLDRFYVPTLNAPLTPYVEINLSSAFLG
jgi:hypothetical protein